MPVLLHLSFNHLIDKTKREVGFKSEGCIACKVKNMESEKKGDENGIIVLTTTEKAEDAEKLCSILLEKKLAACIQILGPIKSRYWWEGKIEQGTEFLCLIKTSKERYVELEKEIKANHPYVLPEILSVEIDLGSKDYLKWMLKIVMER